jgi:hypothetical protein
MGTPFSLLSFRSNTAITSIISRIAETTIKTSGILLFVIKKIDDFFYKLNIDPADRVKEILEATINCQQPDKNLTGFCLSLKINLKKRIV